MFNRQLRRSRSPSKKWPGAAAPGALLASAAVFVLTMADSPSALAQEEDVEEIVVTGSRLVRRDLDAPSPVVVITSADVQNPGNATIEETLNEMPQLASDNTSSVNSGGGSGILTADLRGLDAVRTLVLVNGRRFAPADSRGLTDLTSIPDVLVERVEIMTGGASAVYGSDAIAGAINFVLKDDFEGLEFSYRLGETSGVVEIGGRGLAPDEVRVGGVGQAAGDGRLEAAPHSEEALRRRSPLTMN